MTPVFDDSQAVVIRAWPHGDVVIARITIGAADGRPPMVIKLSGEEAITHWIASWLRALTGDALVTRP